MYDPAPKRGPLTPQERWIFGIFLITILGLFVAEICHDYQPIKLSAVLVVVFWIPLLAWHEAGHAIAAALLGWRVRQIVIGMGRMVVSFRIGGAAVQIRSMPIEGFVQCVPYNLSLPHLKSALIYFAGPGVELLLASIILLIVGPDTLLTQSEDYWVLGWQSLALASTVQAVLNLIPCWIQTAESGYPNDGLGILRSFLLPESYYADLIVQAFNEQENSREAETPADR